MTYSLLQSNHSAGTPSTIAYPGANTSGSLLFLAIEYADAGTVTNITDTVNTWAKVGTTQDDATNSQKCECWWANNTSTGTLTVTITHTGTYAAVSVAIDEWSGVATSSPLRASDTTKAFANDVVASNALTVVAGDLVVGAYHDTTGIQASIAAAGGATIGGVELGSGGVTGATGTAFIAAAGTSQAVSFTVGTAGHRSTVQVAAFIPVAAAATGNVLHSTVPFMSNGRI